MAKYKHQIEVTRAAHMASRAISDASVIAIDDAVEALTKGTMSLTEFKKVAKRIVRKAYNESATIAKNLTVNLANIPQWKPSGSVTNSAYLVSLLSDVERNIQTFSNSLKDEKAIRALALKVKLSAITGAERGFTDSQLEHYGELRDMGYRVEKLWLANFINNEPCIDCVHLHGTQVEFDKEFPIPTLMKTSIYRDLQGPPLHVRCKCLMVVLITTATNIFDKVVVDSPNVPATMTTETVKKLPLRIFNAIIRVLKTITGRKADD